MLIILCFLINLVLLEYAFAEQLYAWQDERGLYGFVDESGNWVILPQYAWAQDFRGCYAKVKVTDEEDPELAADSDGIIDRSGNFVLPPEYTVESCFLEDGYGGGFGSWDKGYYSVTKVLEEDSQYGYFDIRSGFFSDLVYDMIWDSEGDGDLIPVIKNKNQLFYLGYVERNNGRMIIPCEFFVNMSGPVSSFPNKACTLTPALIDHESGELTSGSASIFFDTGEKVSLAEGYNTLPNLDMGNGLVPICETETGLWGYADSTGSVVIPPTFLKVSTFTDGKARAIAPDGVACIIDIEGHVVMNEINEDFPIDYFGDKYDHAIYYAVPYKNNNYCYVDWQGNVVISGQFDYAEDSIGKYAAVEVWSEITGELRNGIIDMEGNWVMSPSEKNQICSAPEGRYFVVSNSLHSSMQGAYKKGYFDAYSGFFSGFQYDDVLLFSTMDQPDLIPVRVGDLFGFAQRNTGDVVIPCIYAELLSPFENGYARVKRIDGTICLTDSLGRETDDCDEPKAKHSIYDENLINSDVLVAKKIRDAEIGEDFLQVSDQNGETVFAIENPDIIWLSDTGEDHLLWYETRDTDGHLAYGLISMTGEFITEPVFALDSESYFVNGLCLVRDRTTGNYGYINDLGEWVIPPHFIEAEPFDTNGRARVLALCETGDAKYEQCFFQLIDTYGNAVFSVEKMDSSVIY